MSFVRSLLDQVIGCVGVLVAHHAFPVPVAAAGQFLHAINEFPHFVVLQVELPWKAGEILRPVVSPYDPDLRGVAPEMSVGDRRLLITNIAYF